MLLNPLLSAGVYGFTLCLSLIFAIGAQNAFVLRQGLKREHVLLVCLTCALSDTLLISMGVSGFAEIARHYPQALDWVRWFGAIFLVLYGARSFWLAWSSHQALDAGQGTGMPPVQAILTALALTWLNPHVYLDTVFLLGSLSAQFQQHLMAFVCGALLASWVFFFALGYGAALLRPIFANPRAWQVLDVVIGVVMWSIAWQLWIWH